MKAKQTIKFVLSIVLSLVGFAGFFTTLWSISYITSTTVALERSIAWAFFVLGVSGVVCSLVTILVGVVLTVYYEIEIEVARVEHNDKRNI